MIFGQLVVERGTHRGPSEDWGEYEFLSLPSPGDRVMVDRDGQENYLTVLCVHHQFARRGSSAQPAAEVVTKWTGKAPEAEVVGQ